jgi:hypothetical protein
MQRGLHKFHLHSCNYINYEELYARHHLKDVLPFIMQVRKYGEKIPEI